MILSALGTLVLSCSSNHRDLSIEVSNHPITGKWRSATFDDYNYTFTFDPYGTLQIDQDGSSELPKKSVYVIADSGSVEFYFDRTIGGEKISVRLTQNASNWSAVKVRCFPTENPEKNYIIDFPRICSAGILRRAD